jgi:hypothetical protein
MDHFINLRVVEKLELKNRFKSDEIRATSRLFKKEIQLQLSTL